MKKGRIASYVRYLVVFILTGPVLILLIFYFGEKLQFLFRWCLHYFKALRCIQSISKC